MKEKITIMKTPPSVTEEEMKALMDFDSLLIKGEAVIRAQRKIRRLRNVTLVIAVSITFPSLIFLLSMNGKSPSRDIDKITQSPPPLRAVPRVSDTTDAAAIKKQLPPSFRPAEKPAQLQRGNESLKKDGPASQRQSVSDERHVALEEPVYVQAEPADGYPALYEYFSRNLRYPAAAVKDSVTGVVNVAFVIDSAGNATKIAVEKSLGPAFDSEVVRLIANMPPWKPASYDGKAVKSKISLPITFSLERKSNP